MRQHRFESVPKLSGLNVVRVANCLKLVGFAHRVWFVALSGLLMGFGMPRVRFGLLRLDPPMNKRPSNETVPKVWAGHLSANPKPFQQFGFVSI